MTKQTMTTTGPAEPTWTADFFSLNALGPSPIDPFRAVFTWFSMVFNEFSWHFQDNSWRRRSDEGWAKGRRAWGGEGYGERSAREW